MAIEIRVAVSGDLKKIDLLVQPSTSYRSENTELKTRFELDDEGNVLNAAALAKFLTRLIRNGHQTRGQKILAQAIAEATYAGTDEEAEDGYGVDGTF